METKLSENCKKKKDLPKTELKQSFLEACPLMLLFCVEVFTSYGEKILNKSNFSDLFIYLFVYLNWQKLASILFRTSSLLIYVFIL